MRDQERSPEETIREFTRPAEEDERRALRWLADVRVHGGPLERRYSTSVIDTLAWFEEALAVLGRRLEQAETALWDIATSYSEDDLAWAIASEALETDSAAPGDVPGSSRAVAAGEESTRNPTTTPRPRSNREALRAEPAKEEA